MTSMITMDDNCQTGNFIHRIKKEREIEMEATLPESTRNKMVDSQGGVMTADKLIEHLKTFPPTTPVKLWKWTSTGSIESDIFVGCNVESQRKNGVITLSEMQGSGKRTE